MKFSSLFTLVILCISVGFMGCGDSDSEAKKAARENLNVPETVAPPVTTTNNSTNTNIAGVPHYICPNKCEGSGGPGAGTCPVCGTAYEHNQDYHNNSTPSTPPTTGTTPPTTTPPAGAAQNAAGVYHYICSSGCAGGAAGAGNCATCGNALTHNQDFHN